MVDFIQQILPYLVVALNLLTVLLFVALVARNSWGGKIVDWVGKQALLLGLIISLGAVSGSLFYSVALHYIPCVLCYWQRIAVYPLLVIFVIALIKKDRRVFQYVVPLSLVAFVISIYHSYIQFGGNPLIPCDAAGSCSKLFVFVFGYITIPAMVTSVALAILCIAWAAKIYENRNA